MSPCSGAGPRRPGRRRCVSRRPSRSSTVGDTWPRRSRWGTCNRCIRRVGPAWIRNRAIRTARPHAGRGSLPPTRARTEPTGARLLIANDLAWCDRPVSERPGASGAALRGLTGPTRPRCLCLRRSWPDGPTRLLIIPSLSWRLGELEQWDRADRWSIGQLKEAIAVPLFTREMAAPRLGGRALRLFPDGRAQIGTRPSQCGTS